MLITAPTAEQKWIEVLIMTDSGKIALIKQMMCDFWGYRSDEIRAAEFSVLVEMISTVLDFRGADNGVQ